MKNLKTHNKAVIGTFFASFRFGVASPLYPKTPLHKKCPIQRRYERGSKINKTSHVLDLRHVVERLSALK